MDRIDVSQHEIAADFSEIIEALESPSMANSTDELLVLIGRSRQYEAGAKAFALLAKAASVFESRRGKGVEQFLFANNSHAKTVADGLRAIFPFWPYFVYHGTSSKVLPSIVEDGLVVGHGKSRWEGIVDDHYLSSGIFLTDNWRGAVSWAQATALTRVGKSRKDGTKPIVLRIRAAELDLRPDTRARVPGCLVCGGPINVDNADAYIVETLDGDPPTELPTWMPIHGFAATPTVGTAPATGPRRNGGR